MTNPQAVDDEGADQSRRRERIHDELVRLEERAMWSAQGQLEQAKIWRNVNAWVGVPTAIAAAVAGALVLAVDFLNIASGILALAAAAGGAYLTTVNASRRQANAQSTGNAYLEIQSAARRAYRVDLPWQDLDEARATLSELSERMDEQNKTADPISRRAYRRARKNIESGGQSYAVDDSKGQGHV